MSRFSKETSPNLTIMGGGGGGSTLTSGMVRHFPEANISAIVAMSDDGGSTGRIKNQFEILPPGDVGNILASVASTNEITQLLNHRFGSESDFDEMRMVAEQLDAALRSGTTGYDEQRAKRMLELGNRIGYQVEGGLKGHTYRNFLIAGGAIQNGFIEAIEEISDIIEAKAKVIPVTTDPHTLMMYDGRKVVRGEHAIDTWHVANPDKAYIWLESTKGSTAVQAHPTAIEAIEESNLTVISPGSPNTSIGPVLKPEGVSKALEIQQERGGTLALIGNLENNLHDTDKWCIGRYTEFTQRYIGKRAIDIVIYNNVPDELPDPNRAVLYDPAFIAKLHVTAVPANLVGVAATKNKNDTIKRSDVYHNTTAVAVEITRLNALRRYFGQIAFAHT